MFETFDHALTPMHPELSELGRQTWREIRRTVNIPWLHCEVSHHQDNLHEDVHLFNYRALCQVRLPQATAYRTDHACLLTSFSLISAIRCVEAGGKRLFDAFDQLIEMLLFKDKDRPDLQNIFRAA